MKKVAIIGATGAVGTGVVVACINHNTEVYVMVRKDSKRIDRIPQNPLVHIVYCSMEEMKTFDVSQIGPVDVFYYFAWSGTHGSDARNDMNSQILNITYTMDAVELSSRLNAKTFIFAGTQAEYGRVEGIISPQTECKPENGYGIAKYCAGKMSRIVCEKLGIHHVIGRIVSTYGPRDGDHSMVSIAIESALEGKNPEFTPGEQLWDYLYSEDAGEAFYLMGEKGKHGKVYVVGSGKTRKLKEFIKLICLYANPNVVPQFGKVPYMDKQVMHLEADISELTKDTGFLPKTEFEAGIKKTIEWYKKNHTF